MFGQAREKIKKQLNGSTKAHLVRRALMLLLLIAVCVIPVALAQRNLGKRAVRGRLPSRNVVHSALLSYDGLRAPAVQSRTPLHLRGDSAITYPLATTGPTCTPSVVQGSITSSDPTQNDLLFRSGVPQTCPPSTSCRIFGDGVRHHYDAYTFANTSGTTLCATIDNNTPCAGNNYIFTAAYLDFFDPENICTSWIGDSGGSPSPERAFQVQVPAGRIVVIVVSEVTPNAGCSSYTVTVSGGLCPFVGPTPTPATPTPTPTPSPSCGLDWHEVASPGVGRLYGIAAVSPNDIWAVGYHFGPASNGLHWDGTQWNSVPELTMPYTSLRAAVAISANDIWIVGEQGSDSRTAQTFTAHWDGSTWTHIASPSVAGTRNALHGVSAVASNDVWAVGYYWGVGDNNATLAMHWDGTQWTIVNTPNTDRETTFYAVDECNTHQHKTGRKSAH